MIRITRWWLLLVVALWGGNVGAAEHVRARVIIIGPSLEHATVARVRDELLLLGFAVRFVPATTTSGSLEATGQRYRAAAVARVEDWPPEIIVWVDPQQGAGAAAVQGEIQVSDSLVEPAEPELLALRAVELLRGSLLPVPGHEPDDTGASGPGQAEPQAGRDRAGARDGAPSASGAGSGPGHTGPDQLTGNGHGVALQVGPALLLSPGGVPATFHVLVGGGYRFVWRLSVDAAFLIPTTAATVYEPAGRMEMRTLLLSGGLSASLTPLESRWLARAGLGLGAAGLFFSGYASAPHVPRAGTEWAAAPYLTVGGGYRLHRVVGIRADAQVALLQPEPVLRIVGEEVASFGGPAVVIGLSAEVRP